MPQPLSDALVTSREDLASCAGLLRGGSRTFHAASYLLPRTVREPACALYAFCRLADDAVDQGATDSAGRNAALIALRERLRQIYEGTPQAIAADRALAHVVVRFGIPRALPEALLEGFAWDATGKRYENLADLEAYAARVAGTVGAMMALVMCVRAPEAVARACDLGVAMQLSNIARDVGEDARAGRLYLPLSWLREAGIDPDAWLARPVFDEAIGALVQRLLHRADELYLRANAGIAQLPAACRPGIYAARYLYAAIGDEVARRGHDSVSQRAVVPATRKLVLVTRALANTLAGTRSDKSPPLLATRFLVDAVAAVGLPASAALSTMRGGERRRRLPATRLLRVPNWAKPADRVVWMLALFERLERQERLARSGSGD